GQRGEGEQEAEQARRHGISSSKGTWDRRGWRCARQRQVFCAPRHISATNYKWVTTREMPDVRQGAQMLHAVLPVLYFAVLLGLSAYGLHRLHLVMPCARHRRTIALAMHTPPIRDDELPPVTIQLPLFNESTVAARLLDAVAAIDYPAHLLEIQVLDDS